MATKAIEKELLTLEKKYWQAIKDKDFEAAMSLTDDPCIVSGAQGIGSIPRSAFEKMMKNATYELEEFKVDDDVKVRLLNDDVAILAYKVHEKLTVDGKSVTLEAADASTWIRRNGHWLCALHTESIAGDPYGRDRHPTQ